MPIFSVKSLKGPNTSSSRPDSLLNMAMPRGILFDIRRYAINDGPGIRSTLFFKGCNLHCSWCHNPEGISPLPVKMFTASRCIGCGTCFFHCPSKAITMTDGKPKTGKELCRQCGTCARVCPAGASLMAGQVYTTQEVITTILKDRILYDESGGGVTFSGGEPLLQHAFLLEMLKECGLKGIHRAVDTAGNVSPAILNEVAAVTDLFLYDLKIMNEDLHRRWTGVSNRTILDNLKLLSRRRSAIHIRIPLIGGINDDEENISATAHFLTTLPHPVEEVSLLPFHAIAVQKYQKLGEEEMMTGFEEPTARAIARAAEIFRRVGLPVTTGG